MIRGAKIATLMVLLVAFWSCGGGSAIQVTQPPPVNGVIISPSSTDAGSPDLVLTVTGANFHSGHFDFSQAFWSANGVETALTTTVVTVTRLKATVPAVLLAAPVTASLFVRTGDRMGDVPLVQSSSAVFTVRTRPAGSTSISSISPSSAVAGSPDVLLTVTGVGFEGQTHFRSYVVWSADAQNTLLATTFVSSTQLTAFLPAALLASPVAARLVVETGDIMGDVSLPRSNAIISM